MSGNELLPHDLEKADWRETWAYLIGMQAYAYGFPAIYYAKLRFGMVKQTQGVIDTPLNTLFHVPRLSDHNDQYGGSPMRDAIYSVAWLDLREEPVVIHSPDSGERYVSIQLAEFYSDLFGYVGPSVNGGRAQTALVVGPQWQCDTPVGIDVVLRSPTPSVFLVARVSTPGGTDLNAARSLQEKSWIKPLSAWQSGQSAPEVRDVLVPFAPTTSLADFRTLNAAMLENPPPAGDEALLRQFAQVGLGPMATTAIDDLDAMTQRGLARALVDGPKLLAKVALTGGNTRQINGWFYGDKHWGRMAAAGDFLGRASPQAFSGIIEHWKEQSTKLRTFIDADGSDLTGQHRYVLRFGKDEIPEAQAFWSITLYDERFNLADNPIQRYGIGSLSEGLQFDADGGLTIWLQHERPTPAQLANWLPTPAGKFNLFLRTYLPGSGVMDQSYAPPPVCKSKDADGVTKSTSTKKQETNMTISTTLAPADQAAMEHLERVFRLQKDAFRRSPYPSAKQRIELMQRVPGMLTKYRQKILQALDTDFGGHSHDQGDLLEILGMFDRAKFNIDNVAKWMRPVSKASNPITQGDSRAYIKYQPKGVVGNMVSWNFPFDIAVGPMLDSLGAGNRVIIKPSDMSPACGQLLHEMCKETFDEEHVAVVNGGLEFARHFPTLPWDHLVYTGSGAVGRQVMQAAAINLVPVTLELGGKCPAIVAPDSLLDERTITTIAGIKVIKRGQMCVTVDYCLVPESGLKAFTEGLANHMKAHFTQKNAAPHACGIISERHVARLNKLIEEARNAGAQVIQIGADLQAGGRDMPFYLVVNPSDELGLMQQEIFGPILPIKTYRDTADAIAYINKGDRPLGLYVFAKDRAFIDQVTEQTQSGGVAVNTIALQAGQPSMGFGGSGASGMGRHHGEEGFREFSNPRGYFERGAGGTLDWIIPPYGAGTRTLIDKVAYAPIGQQALFALKQLPKNLMAKFR
jgi:coniferyl-aldehyde dehydrogenase